MKNLTRIAIAALALAPILGFAQTLAPSQDAYIVPGNGSNFGTATTITVGSSAAIGLVQFDLTQLPAGLTSGQIQKATLTLFLDHVNSGGSINIDTVSASTLWGELTVTGNSGISPGVAVNTSLMTNTADTFIAVDATSAVQGWITTPSSNNGFMIQANATTSVQFDSKENTSTSHPATLTIVLASVGPTGATGATGPTGSSGSNGAAGATGPTGSAGTNGTNGSNGAAGPTGPIGTSGTNGSNGATGPTGSAGTNGTNGSTGATGPAGSPGTNGTNGTNGSTGATGPTGASAGATFTVGASIASPLTTGATVSGTSVVYFVADQATGIKLPAATTVGQQLILIGNAPTNANSGFTIQATAGELINVGSGSSSANNFRALDAIHLVSDGSGTWWAVSAQ